MWRRDFLGVLGAGLAQPSVPLGFVASDVAKLKRVLVHPPGPETRKGLGLDYGPPRFLGRASNERAQEDHAAMVQLLRQSGAEVLTIEGVLDEAIAAARKDRHLTTWLRGWAPQLAARPDKITAAALLGAADEFLYHYDPDGNFQPLVDVAASFYWTRDSAVMTPRGVMLCAFANEGRLVESTLMRFAYEWSPSLRKYPILFDAAEEQLAMEGGDVIVADDHTLWMGVGNRTQEAAARRVAQKLEMDVLAVEMPTVTGKRWSDPAARTALHGMFLHLDTICTLVDQKTVVTLPYFLEQEWAGKDPLTKMLRGLAKSPKTNETVLNRMADTLATVGTVKRYRAGSGELDAKTGKTKWVDHLRSQGYRVIFAGGPLPEKNAEQHVAEQILREVQAQAANVVAVAPGKVLAYAGNRATIKALTGAGIEVITFPGYEIMRNNGGPHCLTQPLERIG